MLFNKFIKQRAIMELMGAFSIQINSMDDLFDGFTLPNFFSKMISDQAERFNFDQQGLNTDDQKLEVFERFHKFIEKYANEKNIVLNEVINLPKLIYNKDMEELSKIFKQIFRIFLDQEKLIKIITSLSQDTQQDFKEIFQQILIDEEVNNSHPLLSKIEELQQQLSQRQHQKQEAIDKINFLEENRRELFNTIDILKQQVDEYRKRFQEYQQFQIVLSQKDQQIRNHQQSIRNLRLALQKQKFLHEDHIQMFEQQIAMLKESILQYQNDNQMSRLIRQNDEKTKKLRQLEDRVQKQRTSAKMFHQRCKMFQGNTKRLQSQIIEMQFQVETQQLRVEKLILKIKQLEKKLQQETQLKERMVRSLKSSKVQCLEFDIDYKFRVGNSPSVYQCTNADCQNQKQKLEQYKKKYNGICRLYEKLKNDNSTYLRNCHNTIDEKSKIIEQFGNTMEQLNSENIKLKEKLVVLSHQLDSQRKKYKDSEHEVIHKIDMNDDFVRSSFVELKRMMSSSHKTKQQS